MLGGFTGFGGTTLPCCYKSHLILMSIVIFSTIIFCLVMFGQVTNNLLFSKLKKEELMIFQVKKDPSIIGQ